MTPSALAHVEHFAAHAPQLVLFLDYDGTLTPIAARPDLAELNDPTRQVLQRLVRHLPVAILSGRDLRDLRECVKIDNIIYAGSHGFDIAGPGGLHKQVGAEFLPVIDLVEQELREGLDAAPGALVERKRFAVAAHYRNVAKADVTKIEQFVVGIAARHPELRKIDNKKVFELQPDVDWNKGKAVIWILDSLAQDRFAAERIRRGESEQRLCPLYIGDDFTDEDAFRAIEQHGISIVVAEELRSTAAHYALRNPLEVERLLRELADLLPLKS
jgi:trehalose-phosphatase